MANWVVSLLIPVAGLLGLGLLLGSWAPQERLEPVAHLLAVDGDDSAQDRSGDQADA